MTRPRLFRDPKTGDVDAQYLACWVVAALIVLAVAYWRATT